MASIGRTLGAYLADGLQVWLFPVSTFQRAADREFSAPTFVVVLLILGVMSGIVAFLSSIPLLGGALLHMLPLALLSELLWVFVQVVIGGALLYGAVRLFGSRASIRRMFSTMLVFPALQLIASLVALVVFAVMIPMSSDPMSTMQTLGTLASVGSLALSLIMISYMVIAARFGGVVPYPAAFGATFIVLGTLALIYFIIAWTMVVPFVGSVP